MKKLMLLCLLVCCDNGCLFAMDALREKIKAEQELVLDDVHDIDSVKKVINDMYQLDQQMREQYLKDRSNKEIIDRMFRIDCAHTVTMKAIIAQHGVDDNFKIWCSSR